MSILNGQFAFAVNFKFIFKNSLFRVDNQFFINAELSIHFAVNLNPHFNRFTIDH